MDKFSNISLKNIAWFNDVNQKGNLDMSPSYQRNAVWTTRQKSYLVDSILNGYPIPEIYIQEEVDDEGHSKFIIVDGQQRLRAVLEFLDNKFSLNKDDSPSFNGAFFSDLQSDLKRIFFRYNFIVRTIPEMPENEIRNIFKRLNLNVVSLNAQEIRRAAYSGGLIKFVSKLSANPFWGNMHIFSANDVKRLRDEQFISELSLLAIEGITNKKDRLDNFFEKTEVDFSEKDLLEETFQIVFDTLNPMASELSKTRWRNKTDFYTLFSVICDVKQYIYVLQKNQSDILSSLIEFSKSVNECLKVNEELGANFPEYIKNYTKGVRASTDYKARLLRKDSLKYYLQQKINELAVI